VSLPGIEVTHLSIQPELVQAVAAFVPDHVVQGIVNGHPQKPGDSFVSEGAVIFADVAGFTPMAERLARVMRDQAHQGEARGAEELNRIINQAFSAMMKPIQQRGGIVTHFSGDALTAYFERPASLSPSDVVTSTLACAHAMHRAILPFAEVQVENETFLVSVKIGVGYGMTMVLTVGDEASDMESVLFGQALEDAAAAERHAQRGQIVLAPSAWLLLSDSPPSPEDQVEEGLGSVLLHEFRLMPPLKNDITLLPPIEDPLAGLDAATQKQVIRFLAPYLPQPIYERLLVAQGDLPGDYRRVTNLFVYFEGLDLSQHSAHEECSPGARSAADGAGKTQADALELAQKAQAYYSWVHTIVDQYEGRLIRMLADDKGTNLHILFGAPDKHADDPTRGLRCALALQRGPGLPPFITRQRIGVASGIVFAATIGSPRRREYTVIGNEVNLSARLTAACPTGEVLVDTYTRDRTARQFEFEALAPMQLKGKSETVIAYRLLAERPSETGLVARYLSSRWPIVGRDAEVALMTQSANQALEGSGRIIAIEGQAGVGKTRLIEEVVRHWVDRGGDGFVGQTVSHGSNSPYHIWANFWQAFFGFGEADSSEQRWQKVETVIAQEAPDLAPWIGILAPVLGLRSPETSLLSRLDASDRRRKLFEVTLTLLVAHAHRQPLLILFEDLHWADQPSLELIDYVGEHISQASLLLCVCFRPRENLDLNVLTSMHCTWRILDELQPQESADLVRTILGEVDLPPALEQGIYNKTQGNPLFVEEVLNSFIANGILVSRNGGYRLSGDPSAITIPDTLQDLLMARIDKLEAPSRDLVQVASVVDRRFPYAILRAIYPYPMSNLEMQERLNELIRPLDLTRLDRPEPDLVYLFKHALTRDVAYASLPFARRRELHRRVGECIETTYADHLEEHYDTLAHHFDQGKQREQALNYALLAGVQAQEVYANDEALHYYQQVEDYLTYLPIQAHWPGALQMYLKRNVLHRLNGDYELADADLVRALDLSQTYGDTRAEAEAYCLLADLRYYEMRNEESLAAALQGNSIASTHNHPAELNASLSQLGIAYEMLGDVECSMEHLRQAYELAEQRSDRLTAARALNTMAVTWWLHRGELDKALDGFQRVLEIWREAGAKHREAECLANIATVQFGRGNYEAALEADRTALRVGRAAGWQYGISYVQLDLADIHCYLGEYETGRQLIQEAEQNLVPGDDLGQAYVQLWLGRNIYFDLGRDDLAVPILEASLTLMRDHSHYDEMIVALTALGSSHWRQGRLDEAHTNLSEAHELSLTQNFPWQRAEIRYRLGLVALSEDKLEEADNWAQLAQSAVSEGSVPDWLGPTHVLIARIARRRGVSASQIVSLYQHAVSLVETRCRRVEHARTLREAGRYLTTHADRDLHTQGQTLVRQAEEWLAVRGISD
jgi:predicted ATPase/class 3 adenylate cyclase